MNNSVLLGILRCPITGQRLQVAPPEWVESMNRAINDGRLYDVGQRAVETPVSGALIVDDGSLLYPVRNGIPTLIPDWAIRSGELATADRSQRGG